MNKQVLELKQQVVLAGSAEAFDRQLGVARDLRRSVSLLQASSKAAQLLAQFCQGKTILLVGLVMLTLLKFVQHALHGVQP